MPYSIILLIATQSIFIILVDYETIFKLTIKAPSRNYYEDMFY